MSRSVSTLTTTILAACIAAAPSAYADCAKDPECDALTPWTEFTAMTIRVSVPDSKYAAEWRGKFDHKTSDTAIDVDTKGPDGEMKGTIAMVGGRVMMSKGLTLPRGSEIDAIDAPVLSMKLAMIVLGRVFPRGPTSISGEKQIDRTDKAGIKYATPSAEGYVAAPWRVTGKVKRHETGNVTFDLSLTMPVEDRNKPGKTYTMMMAGEFSMLRGPVLADTASLDGWTTYGVGPLVEKQGDTTKYDYGAKPESVSRFKTIADIRAHIAEEQNPGTRDSTKDFTGFWKTKCEDAFGLQIKPYGSDGKYSIVFCGPGGCGDPAEGRKTFVTGDKHFQVISEDELIEIGRSGDRQRHLRCTRDIHPVLKY